MAVIRLLCPLLLLSGIGVLALINATRLQSQDLQDVILKPVKDSDVQVALVLITGPSVKPEQYSPLVKAIQNASTYSLWVGIPEYPFDKVFNIVEVGINRILLSLQAEGMASNTKLFFAAHSPESANALQEYLVTNTSLAHSTAGQILMGSFLQRAYHNSTYPVKTMIIGGELDGVCRVTRIMEEFYYRIQLAKNFTEAVANFPVVIVKGMTHFQFASGDMPANIKANDFKSEISYDNAHLTVAALVSNFTSTALGNTDLLVNLKDAVSETGVFLKPIIEAYRLEASYKLKTPCLENPPSPSCQVGCPWTQIAMVTMAELKLGTVNDTDQIHPASEIIPKIHHPSIFNSCSQPSSHCTVLLSSVSENIYLEEKSDDGQTPTSANEIRAKLKSRQSVMIAAGYGNVDFNVSDAGSRCKTINQQSYDWALNNSHPVTLSRFKQHGVHMVMGEDKGCFENGGLWIYLPMHYVASQNSTGGAVLVVESIQMKTPVTYPIKMFQGMHYCKLLSPARAMEWIYVDSLRQYYSV